MNKLRTVSRADLLLTLLTAHDGLDNCASVFGYERKSAPSPLPGTLADAKLDSAATTSEPAQEPQLPEIHFPTERPRLKFLAAMRAEKLQAVPRTAVGNPITDAELSVDWTRRGTRLLPLARWSRLGFFLRTRLGRMTAGTQLDQEKLMKLAGSGLPLTELPRRERRAWAPQAVVLWDRTPEMFPFARDVPWLLDRLRRERGGFGLIVRELRRAPRTGDVAGVPAGTPLLAISAMGCFARSPDITADWIKLAKRLNNLGLPLIGLNPCPRDRWSKLLAEVCQCVVWDRHPRMPRHRGQRAKQYQPEAPASETTQDVHSLVPSTHSLALGAGTPGVPLEPIVERLLTLLSPASRIEAPLLRAARLKLGREADAGTEWDAWHHADCWHSIDCFGILPGTPIEKRLELRSQLDGHQAALARQIGDMMSEHHAGCSQVIRAEAELRACLSGSPSEATLALTKELLQRVVDRLRQVAKQPGGAEGEQTGLPMWFAQMVDRLSPAMRMESTIKELLAQGLALAHTWLETPRVVVPIEMDREAFDRELRAVVELPPDPIPFETALRGNEVLVFPTSDRPISLVKPACHLRAGHGRIQIHASDQHSVSVRCETNTKTSMVLDRMPSRIQIETLYDRLHLESMERPEWAVRMWSDCFGIGAEFVVRDVPFVLRWIPPGTFWMGSPRSELGRFSSEGPQHEVTISQGFWIGETPVTQAQWAAVVEAGKADKQIAKDVRIRSKPSRFQSPKPNGLGNLPVEQVTWTDSNMFSNLLNRILAIGPGFRLPTEAQWEYACRAGTHSAFNDGSACTVPEGLDPALDHLGWFTENSGGKTQIVKQKPANRWGLYDMHGNVWEWCADAWLDKAYAGRKGGVIDPIKIGSRVVRGGSWFTLARVCRAADRYRRLPGHYWGDLGLRLSAGQELETREAEPKRRSRGGGTTPVATSREAEVFLK